MRFPSGWKLLAVGELRPVDTRQRPDPAATDPLYLAPETASAVLSRAGHVQLRPSMVRARARGRGRGKVSEP